MDKYNEQFEQIFNDKIKPLLPVFEQQRIKVEKASIWAFPVVIGSLVGLIGAILHLELIIKIAAVITAFGAITSLIFWAPLEIKYRRNLKNILLTKILSIFGKFYYLNKQVVTLKEIKQFGIFPRGRSKYDDDVIVGTYKGIDLSITETEISHRTGGKNSSSKIIDFSGLILKIQMNKNFEGVTVIRQRSNNSNITFSSNGIVIHSNQKSTPKNLTSVKLEDMEFEKHYETFSDNQVEARYLITPTFIERFKNISQVLAINEAYCVFKDNYIFLFLGHPRTELINNSAYGFFEFTVQKGQTLYDKSIYRNIISQLIVLFEFISYFKLDQKIGL